MIVLHLSQRKNRCGNDSEHKPRESKRSRPACWTLRGCVYAENKNRDEQESAQAFECEYGFERLQIGVRAEVKRKKERHEVAEPDVRLRDQITIRRERAWLEGLGCENGLERRKGNAEHKGWKGFEDHAFPSFRERRPLQSEKGRQPGSPGKLRREVLKEARSRPAVNKNRTVSRQENARKW